MQECLDECGDYILPIAMLSAFSVELYFKGLYTEVKEYYGEGENTGVKKFSEYSSDEFKENWQVKGSMLGKEIESLNKGNHDLLRLFENLEKTKPRVYNNLLEQYQKHLKRELLDDLKECKDIFKDGRYPYETLSNEAFEGVCNKQKKEKIVIANFNEIYYLAKFLYTDAKPYEN
ncbi:hypothetical protein ACH0AB_10720 [Moraxella sp. 179-F 1C4 NHS]